MVEPAAPASVTTTPQHGAHPIRAADGSNATDVPPGSNGGPVAYPKANGHVDGNGHIGAAGPMNGNGHAGGNGGDRSAGCTAPQLRRFIKSRPYVPMHELRRRFAIDGNDDDVTPVDLEGSKVYVGLPPREGSLLGELLRGGEIGYELSFDPLAPIVVGVYPMRPVPRT